MGNSIQNARQKAFNKQAGHCFYCGLRMWQHSPDELVNECGLSAAQAKRLQCTAEHLRARCNGGRNTLANIVAACAHCNHTRHLHPNPPIPSVYREEVRARISRGKWHHPEVVELTTAKAPPG